MFNKRKTILQWAENLELDAKNVDSALKQVNALPSTKDWGLFLNRLLIWLGVIALAFGVIFFFAYNWQEMNRFTKFALVECGLLISLVSYLFLNTLATIKTAILFAMSLMIGALLALVGQTYQTGADPWQLFTYWSVLILPLVVVSRASSLWLLWAALVNLSLLLYLQTNRGIFNLFFNDEDMFWVFGTVNSILMLVLEFLSLKQNKIGNRFKRLSINNRYAAQVVTLVAGFTVTWLAFIAIFDPKSYYAWGFLVYIVWMALAYRAYRHYYKDLLLLSACTLSAITVVIALLIKALEDSFGDGGFLVLTIAIIGLSSMAAIWLKKLSKEFAGDYKPISEEL